MSNSQFVYQNMFQFRFSIPAEMPYLIRVLDIGSTPLAAHIRIGFLRALLLQEVQKIPETIEAYITELQGYADEIGEALETYFALTTRPSAQDIATLREVGLNQLNLFHKASQSLDDMLKIELAHLEADHEIYVELSNTRKMVRNLYPVINTLTLPCSECVLYLLDQIDPDSGLMEKIQDPERFVRPSIVPNRLDDYCVRNPFVTHYMFVYQFDFDIRLYISDFLFELRNPMAAIGGTAQFLDELIKDDPEKDVLSPMLNRIWAIYLLPDNRFADILNEYEDKWLIHTEIYEYLLAGCYQLCAAFVDLQAAWNRLPIHVKKDVTFYESISDIKRLLLKVIAVIDSSLGGTAPLSSMLNFSILLGSHGVPQEPNYKLPLLPTVLDGLCSPFTHTRREMSQLLKSIFTPDYVDDVTLLLQDMEQGGLYNAMEMLAANGGKYGREVLVNEIPSILHRLADNSQRSADFRRLRQLAPFLFNPDHIRALIPLLVDENKDIQNLIAYWFATKAGVVGRDGLVNVMARVGFPAARALYNAGDLRCHAWFYDRLKAGTLDSNKQNAFDWLVLIEIKRWKQFNQQELDEESLDQYCLETITRLEEYLLLRPHFSYKAHNELRHHYGAIDEEKSMFHANVILCHQTMSEYMLDILGGWYFSQRNSASYDPRLGIDQYLRNVEKYGQFTCLVAACLLKVAEAHKELGEPEAAFALYQQVLDMEDGKEPALDDYQEIARAELGV